MQNNRQLEKAGDWTIGSVNSGDSKILAPGASFMLALDRDGYPKTDNSQLQFRGLMELEKFEEAFDEVVIDYPITQSFLEPRRRRGVERLHWVRQADSQAGPPNRLKYFDCRADFAKVGDPVQFVQDFHQARTVRRMDLLKEYPVSYYLLQLEDEVHLFSMVYHHIAIDAASGYEMIAHLLASYHEKVTGTPPSWANAAAISSQAQARKAGEAQPRLTFLREQFTEYYLKSQSDVSQVASEMRPGLLGRHCHRGIHEDPKVLSGLKLLARRHKASLGDILSASIARTISVWDREHGSTKRSIRSLIMINARGRVPELADEGMALSGFVICLRGADELTIDEVISHFCDQRISQFEKGVDVANLRMLDTIARMTIYLPRRLRAFIARRAMTMRTTFLLSNIGIMWPEIIDGRLTGGSAITAAGGLEIDDVHSCPSTSPDVGVGVIARSLGGRLFLNYTTDRLRFTADTAQALTTKITEDLNELGKSVEVEALES